MSAKKLGVCFLIAIIVCSCDHARKAIAQEVAQPSAAGTSAPASAAAEAKATLSPEVRAALEQGIKHLEAKQSKEAINAFLAAARQYPKSGQMRHLLGLAYVQDKQLGPAWLQLRQAVRFNPTYQPSIRDFMGMWSTFDKRGVFNSGRSAQQLAKLLGEPDRKKANQDSSREVWEYGFMRLHFSQGLLMAIIDPRGMDPEVAKATDVLDIEFDDESRWSLGYRTMNRLQSVTEYVPKEQSVQKWNELYTVQRLYNMRAKTSPLKMMTQIEENLRKNNPEIDFVQLADGENDVLFHWRDKGTEDRNPQHEIVRLIAGEKDIHRVAYARRVAQIPAEEAQAWLNRLRSAVLTQPPAPVVDGNVAPPANN